MLLTREFTDHEYLMMVTRGGTVKRIRLDALYTARKAGDTKEFVDDNGGTYVFFFQDFAETYRDLLVTNKLKTEWYDEVTSAATYTYDADAAKHANLGLTIASIYGSSSSSN